MSFPILEFNTLADVVTYTNNEWIPNGNGEITGIVGNNIINGLAKFIAQAPLNYNKAIVWTTGGSISSPTTQVPGPVIIFAGITPTLLTLNDNIYFQYVILNATSSPVPLASASYYFDVLGNLNTSIPPNSVVVLYKAKNNNWYQGGGTGSGSQASTRKPLTGIAGNGGANDPIIGQTTYQNDALIGLGDSNGRLMININGLPMVNFGTNSSFSFNQTTGTVSGLNPWFENDSLYIDLNQQQ